MSPTAVPTLSDGEVVLRAHRADDVERVHQQCVDPLTRAWTSVPPGYTRAMAVEFVEQIVPAGWQSNREWTFALDVAGRFGGSLTLRAEVPGRAEIGYGAHPDVRGTGAVGRGLRLLVDWGFGPMGLQALEWRAAVGNWPSRRAAWRLGFVVEGTLRRKLVHAEGLRDAWVGTLLCEDPREPNEPWVDDVGPGAGPGAGPDTGDRTAR